MERDRIAVVGERDLAQHASQTVARDDRRLVRSVVAEDPLDALVLRRSWRPVLAAHHVGAAPLDSLPSVELAQRLLTAPAEANEVELGRVAPD